MEEKQTIGVQQLREFTRVLQRYSAGLAQTRSRIISSENWWKLRNTAEERKTTGIGGDGGFRSVSGWLHNVIVSKHADAMEAYPEPNILPREAADTQQARMLTAVVPCVLEQNQFEKTYSDVMWQKLKTGTGGYKVVGDSGKLGGLGDISIQRCNLLNLYWEPGVTDIQQSRYFFHTQLQDKELLQQRYPQLRNKLHGTGFLSTRFLYDDTVSTDDKVTVIEVYYHKIIDGRQTVQYCRYVEDTVLFSTENEGMESLYDHGRYPFEFDPLYPIEGSPCGYGYVDICRNPQTEIDLLKTSFVKNAMVGATPRYFKRSDGGVNEQQFLDLSQPLVEVAGSMDDNALRQIGFHTLDGVYVNVLDRTIQELRQTSGNTETSTGNISSGVTAASAIAALQEASGKGSRDSTLASYRAFSRVVELCIALIRQFYTVPRQFRITGELGAEQYVRFDNRGIMAQGEDLSRLPVFDIKVSAQKKTVYTKISQNELAAQFFRMGFFDPKLTEQAMLCLELMDFDGKDAVMQKVARNGRLQDKLDRYRDLALLLAKKAAPHMVEGLLRDGAEVPELPAMPAPEPVPADRTEAARAAVGEAVVPKSGRVIGKEAQ